MKPAALRHNLQAHRKARFEQEQRSLRETFVSHYRYGEKMLWANAGGIAVTVPMIVAVLASGNAGSIPKLLVAAFSCFVFGVWFSLNEIATHGMVSVFRSASLLRKNHPHQPVPWLFSGTPEQLEDTVQASKTASKVTSVLMPLLLISGIFLGMIWLWGEALSN